ncbi:MAG: DUF397 domain-containing protein [Actinobacteria bacterium]|nr:DUF397 domain-containing protein [Actinomycetota bacterium]
MTSANPSERAEAFSVTEWKRALRCGPDGGNCVEVNLSVAGLVAVRDSRRSQSPLLVVDDYEWRSFLIAARTGQFES